MGSMFQKPGMNWHRLSKWPRLLLLITILFVTACGNDNNDNPGNPGNPATPGRGDLVQATIVYNAGGLTLDTILNKLETFYGLDPGITRQYNVTFYKIVYATVDTNGNIVNASGLVSYPAKTSANRASPLLSYQHGTIISDDEAPSNMAARPELGIISTLFSSQGYVVAAPDCLGYGESTQLLHPYIIADVSASATIDLLRAVRIHAAQISHALDGQLFITGYSEGGYVTLASQREMETNLSAEFTITKSIPAAGPYNLSWTADFLINLVFLPSAELLSFVMKAYDTVYDYNRISEIYQAPYGSEVNGRYFYGDVASINLTNTTADLLTPIFLYGPDGQPGGDDLGYRETGEMVLKSDFVANNLHTGWTATTPTILFHGADDLIVPYQNSVDAAAGLGINVNLTACTVMPIADHATCVAPYVNLVLSEFGWPY